MCDGTGRQKWLSQQTSHLRWTQFRQSTVAQGVLAPSARYGAQFDFRLPEAPEELEETSVDSSTVKMGEFRIVGLLL
ncbi:hypothetical protein PFAS1_21805 [Pseudomonas frederiksbergensis]|nr:hypothetical protein PFAS1_21805 [Pseudomonas frederiksbergensis]